MKTKIINGKLLIIVGLVALLCFLLRQYYIYRYTYIASCYQTLAFLGKDVDRLENDHGIKSYTSVRVVHSVSYMDIKHQKNSYIGRWICDKIESDSKLANNGWLAADKWYLNYDKTQGPADAEATQ